MAVHRFLWLVLLASATPSWADFDAASYPPYERCALCHGLFGQSHNAKFPHLAGQKPAYIEAQLEAFLKSTRTNDDGQMSAIVTELKPEEFQVVIEWFSSQDPPQPGDAPEDLIGENLVAELGCLECHTGEAEIVPYLSAQHQGYLEKQMNDFATSARDSGNIHKELLTPVTAEIEAIAAYLSSLERPK
ncbi:MAG: c-type cytochrome [Paracoccaceae bacterium]